MLQNFKQIPTDNYLMLIAVFFMKAGQFMIMPFMAIYLQHFPHSSPTKIGIAIGLGPIAYGLFSPICGWLVDRFGARNITIFALLSGALNIYFFFAVQLWWYCFLMSVIIGVTRSLFDISSRTYRIIQHNLELRRFFFGLRFTVINAAAAFGPFIGALASRSHSTLLFKLVGLCYLVMGFVSWLTLRADKPSSNSSTPQSAATLTSIAAILLKDRTMTYLISATLLFWIVFSQIDSTLPQYLQQKLAHGLQLYPWLLVINAVMCACLQLIVTHSLRNVSVRWCNRAGVVAFCLSSIVMIFAQQNASFLAFIILLTIAELLLAPIQDYLVSIIAPTALVGSYYGALGLAVLGIGIGPVIGGIIFQHSSGTWLYIACTTLGICMGLCYRQVFLRLP